MDKNRLEEIFKESEASYSSASGPELANLIELVPVGLMLDNTNLDVFYWIDVDTLLKSGATDDTYTKLKDGGWSLNKERDKLILYYRSNKL